MEIPPTQEVIINWRLTREAIDGPKIDDWSEWKIMDDSRTAQQPILDRIYAELEDQGETAGVVKLEPGVYIAHGGSWLF